MEVLGLERRAALVRETVSLRLPTRSLRRGFLFLPMEGREVRTKKKKKGLGDE